MTEFVELTKKYGVTGVLACWLWITTTRVTVLENNLKECYQYQMIESKKTSSLAISCNPKLAVLTKKTKIKRNETN